MSHQAITARPTQRTRLNGIMKSVPRIRRRPAIGALAESGQFTDGSQTASGSSQQGSIVPKVRRLAGCTDLCPFEDLFWASLRLEISKPRRRYANRSLAD